MVSPEAESDSPSEHLPRRMAAGKVRLNVRIEETTDTLRRPARRIYPFSDRVRIPPTLRQKAQIRAGQHLTGAAVLPDRSLAHTPPDGSCNAPSRPSVPELRRIRYAFSAIESVTMRLISSGMVRPKEHSPASRCAVFTASFTAIPIRRNNCVGSVCGGNTAGRHSAYGSALSVTTATEGGPMATTPHHPKPQPIARRRSLPPLRRRMHKKPQSVTGIVWILEDYIWIALVLGYSAPKRRTDRCLH